MLMPNVLMARNNITGQSGVNSSSSGDAQLHVDEDATKNDAFVEDRLPMEERRVKNTTLMGSGLKLLFDRMKH